MARILAIFAFLAIQFVYGFIPASKGNTVVSNNIISPSRLFAHHPQKKIIKKKQDKRPKKHRLSDITRKNVNFGKCITKLENAPADYTIISAEDYLKIRAEALNFWETGSTTTKWLEITDEDKALTLPQNIEPLPKGGVQKKPSIVKSGSC